jgi:hypothetical protein
MAGDAGAASPPQAAEAGEDLSVMAKLISYE